MNSQQDNSKFKYEKIKKMLNNPFVKFSLGFVGLGTIGIAAKLIYDKLNNKNIESEKIDEIKLDANDKKFIAKNFFLCKWKNSSCWNDVFIQFFMCPDIRCGNYKSEKIMKTINWINKTLDEKYNSDPLNRKIEVPLDIRPIPDDYKNYLHDGKGNNPNFMIWGRYNSKNFEDLKVVNYTYACHDPVENELFKDVFLAYSNQPCLLNYLGDANNREKNYIVNIEISKNKKKLWNLSECFQLSTRNYYPTYIIVHDDIHYTGSTHVFAYYVIYNENMKIKYFLKVSDLKQNMEIVPKDKVLKELNIYSKFWFVFSRGDIVKKYYVPRAC